MTLQEKLERIGTALTTLGDNVYHYCRPQMQPPFCVWAEEGEDTNLSADNIKKEQAISGYVDYYTQTEYDPALDTVQSILQELSYDMPFGWRLDSVQFEDDTNLIHYQWTWSVA
jgi:hypothetical protein